MSASAVNCAAGRYDRRGAKMSVMRSGEREREEGRSEASDGSQRRQGSSYKG